MRRLLLYLLLLYFIADVAHPVLGAVTVEDSVQATRSARVAPERLGIVAPARPPSGTALLQRPAAPPPPVTRAPAPLPVVRFVRVFMSDSAAADSDEQ
jgi:hypothetical protein